MIVASLRQERSLGHLGCPRGGRGRQFFSGLGDAPLNLGVISFTNLEIWDATAHTEPPGPIGHNTSRPYMPLTMCIYLVGWLLLFYASRVIAFCDNIMQHDYTDLCSTC